MNESIVLSVERLTLVASNLLAHGV